MSHYKWGQIGAFCLTLTLFGVFLFGMSPNHFSQQENRYLQTMPAFSFQDMLCGKWQSQLADFASDQLPLREELVTTSANLRVMEGKRDIGGAYLGKNGYYFDKKTDADIDRVRLTKNLQYINTFASKHPNLSARALLIPSSGNILRENLPAFAKIYDAKELLKSAAQTLTNCQLVNCRKGLLRAKDQYIYYRTDHHWTTEGAYTAYVAYMKDMGLPGGSVKDFRIQTVSNEFLGTLYSKALKRIGPADSVEIAQLPKGIAVSIDGKPSQVYFMDALHGKDKYQVFFGGNPGVVMLENADANNGRILLIVKDSFANCFVPFLISSFQKIIMVDLRNYDESVSDLVQRMRATDLLFLYEISNLASDDHLVKLTRDIHESENFEGSILEANAC